jgi:hypothetical protein
MTCTRSDQPYIGQSRGWNTLSWHTLLRLHISVPGRDVRKWLQWQDADLDAIKALQGDNAREPQALHKRLVADSNA